MIIFKGGVWGGTPHAYEITMAVVSQEHNAIVRAVKRAIVISRTSYLLSYFWSKQFRPARNSDDLSLHMLAVVTVVTKVSEDTAIT